MTISGVGLPHHRILESLPVTYYTNLRRLTLACPVGKAHTSVIELLQHFHSLKLLHGDDPASYRAQSIEGTEAQRGKTQVSRIKHYLTDPRPRWGYGDIGFLHYRTDRSYSIHVTVRTTSLDGRFQLQVRCFLTLWTLFLQPG